MAWAYLPLTAFLFFHYDGLTVFVSSRNRQLHLRSHQPKQHRPVSGDVKPARKNRIFLNKTRSLILLSHFHPYLIGIR